MMRGELKGSEGGSKAAFYFNMNPVEFCLKKSPRAPKPEKKESLTLSCNLRRVPWFTNLKNTGIGIIVRQRLDAQG
jgi:hypothetical protein